MTNIKSINFRQINHKVKLKLICVIKFNGILMKSDSVIESVNRAK